MTDRIGPGYNDALHAVQAKGEVALSNGQLGLCERCEGTGNELYSMFRLCSSCDGEGAVELEDDNG